MLEFNPFFRQTARELLKNPYFDNIRVADNEMHAPFKIQLNIDADDAYSYD